MFKWSVCFRVCLEDSKKLAPTDKLPRSEGCGRGESLYMETSRSYFFTAFSTTQNVSIDGSPPFLRVPKQ